MSRPDDWLRPELRGLQAYQVAEADGLIKLDAMENPFDLPAEVAGQWGEALSGLPVNRYPDAAAREVKQALRQAMGIPASASLMLGNGSDEILQILMLAVAAPDACLVTPAPGFAMFGLIARTVGLRCVSVPLADDFSLDADAMVSAIEREQPALVIVAQPNNPTGNAFDAAALRRVVEAAPGAMVIDEAYFPFADDDCLAWLDDYPQLLIMRTVSKLGLAGLRLGLLAGAPAWIEALEPLRLPYNVNSLTQAAAALALAHYPAFQAQAEAIRRERPRLASALAGLDGVEVFPSQANFLLMRVPPGRAPAWHAALREQGVLIKNLHGSHPRVADCLRATVGTPAEIDALIRALEVVTAADRG
ncbi:histidinol-phosphate transaminase [Salinisphaera sp. P385]|uniref:Histidinol-phosphate aminotransferase n=1 Tax=Spectribacter acetivorans TaxID=3075603 RepID=A0ABU3B6M2_9GAMM|nr:histidinol-phosphate transaminase [Salinisphaera sp. P385]MDT0618098.1 histidinol-phosphate transaminase [Salinisphaera sp. P385]